jgi:hypothetical protein
VYFLNLFLSNTIQHSDPDKHLEWELNAKLLGVHLEVQHGNIAWSYSSHLLYYFGFLLIIQSDEYDVRRNSIAHERETTHYVDPVFNWAVLHSQNDIHRRTF